MMTHPFPEGTRIMTNERYYQLFKRKVIGVSVFPKGIQPPPEITVMRWEYQEGNVIPEQQGQLVLMMSKDLKAFVS